MRGALPHSVFVPQPAPRRRTGTVIAVLALGLLAVLIVSQHRPASGTAHGEVLVGSREHFSHMLRTRTAVPQLQRYNYTYPASVAVRTATEIAYPFVMVADMDEASRSAQAGEALWSSRLVAGMLYRNLQTGAYRVTIEDEGRGIPLVSAVASHNRGAELSELQFYNGKMLTVDDRTGIVYEIVGNNLAARHILADGDGQTSRLMKAEWMALKDRNLYVGSIGRDWTTGKGQYINDYPKWIKIITPNGAVHVVNWTQQYIALQDAAGLPPTGYLWHESAAWSSIHQRWFFLPRRASSEPYDENLDESRGTNLLITADERFERIIVKRVGELDPQRGFSSFKFVPDSKDTIVLALRTREYQNQISSYIVAFDVLSGDIVVPEIKISDHKLEGLEFA